MKKLLAITMVLSSMASPTAGAGDRWVSYIKDIKPTPKNPKGYIYGRKKIQAAPKRGIQRWIQACIYQHISIHNGGVDDAAIQRNLKREPKFHTSRDTFPQEGANKDVIFNGGTLHVFLNQERMKFKPGYLCNGDRKSKIQHMPLMADIYDVLDHDELKTAKADKKPGEMVIVPPNVGPRFRGSESVSLREGGLFAESGAQSSETGADAADATSAAAGGLISERTREENDQQILTLAQDESSGYISGVDPAADQMVADATRRQERRLVMRAYDGAQKESLRARSEEAIWKMNIAYTAAVKKARAIGNPEPAPWIYTSLEGAAMKTQFQDDLDYAERTARENAALANEATLKLYKAQDDLRRLQKR